MSDSMLDHARRHIGVKDADAIVSRWIRAAADWLNEDGSETAWCGCFAGHVVKAEGGCPPPEFFRARAWLLWGEPVALRDAPPGAVVVFRRKGGFHVSFLDERHDGGPWVRVTGGNQGDSVSAMRYLVRDIVGVRKYLVKGIVGGRVP